MEQCNYSMSMERIKELSVHVKETREKLSGGLAYF